MNCYFCQQLCVQDKEDSNYYCLPCGEICQGKVYTNNYAHIYVDEYHIRFHPNPTENYTHIDLKTYTIDHASKYRIVVPGIYFTPQNARQRLKTILTFS
jgi:hypothetical protein